MKYLITICLLIFLSCGTTQQTTSGTPPTNTPPPATDCSRQMDSLYNSIVDSFSRIVRPVRIDSVPYAVHDSFTQVIPIASDTTRNIIWLDAIQYGDNLLQIQAAANYCNTYAWHLKLRPGLYKTSSTIMLVSLVNGVYGQFSIDMAGEFGSKNTPDRFLAIIAPQFWDKPGIIIQQNKGTKIRNIVLQGGYMLASTLAPIQVFSYRPDQWRDGVCSFERTAPYAGLAIDALSDSTDYDGDKYKMFPGLHQWCIPGMSRAGSTDVQIIDCKIMQFVVGIVVTPSFQQNGDLIDVLDCQIGNCYSAYAWTQAQSKQNTVQRLEVWSAVYIVFDGVNYGYQHGDGTFAPLIDNVSIAGEVHSLIQAAAYTFSIKLSNVYGEEIFSIGTTGLNPYSPTVFENCTFDWASSQDNMPSPDFWYEGSAVTFRDCHFRNYNNDSTQRFVLNPTHAIFDGGEMGLPPLLINDQNDLPEMRNVMVFYGRVPWIKRNDYDSVYLVSQATVHLTGNGNGYFVGGNLSTLKQGDLMITTETNINGGIPGILSESVNNQTVIGKISYPVTSDTVFFDHASVSIRNGVTYPAKVCKYKSWFVTN